MATREATLSMTFVQLADSLVDDFDIVDVLTLLSNRCVDVVGANAAASCWPTRAGRCT